MICHGSCVNCILVLDYQLLVHILVFLQCVFHQLLQKCDMGKVKQLKKKFGRTVMSWFRHHTYYYLQCSLMCGLSPHPAFAPHSRSVIFSLLAPADHPGGVSKSTRNMKSGC